MRYNSTMNFLKKNFRRMALIGFVIISPVIALAQGNSPVPCDVSVPGRISNPVPYCSLSEFIRVILEGVLKIGIPIIALAIIYSGFLFVAAQGNSEKLGKAKNALLYTLIGTAILLGSWAIAKLISETVLELSWLYKLMS